MLRFTCGYNLKVQCFWMCLFMASLLFVGVAQAEVVEIQYWGKAGNWFSEIEDTIINEFNKQFEGQYKVVGVPVADGIMQEKLTLAVAANASPDVVRFSRHRTASFASIGLLMPLDNIITAESFNLNIYFPSIVQEGRYQERLYSIPWDTDSRAMFYDEAMFLEAGVNPDQPPSTWEELAMLRPKFTRTNADGLLTRVALLPHYGNYYFEGWNWANGGDLVDSTGRKVIWNDAKGIQTIEWMYDYINYYGGAAAVSDFITRAGDGLGKGSQAMHMQASSYVGTLNAMSGFNWRVANPPRPKGMEGTPSTWSGGFCMAIPMGVDANKQQGAWEFIKFYTDEWAQKYFAVLSGKIPALRAAALSSEVRTLHPEMLKMVALMDYTRTRPVSPFTSEISDILRQDVHLKLRVANLSPSAILQDAARKAQILLDEGWSRLQ
jgi:multiple sugar transport system substrate-binding protein